MAILFNIVIWLLPIPERLRAVLAPIALLAFVLACIGWLAARSKTLRQWRFGKRGTHPLTVLIIAGIGAVVFAGGWLLYPRLFREDDKQNDAVVSVTDAVIPKETVIPFEVGKPIFVNLVMDATGKDAPFNFHHHGRMGFVSTSPDKQDEEIEQLYAPLTEEIATFSREGKAGIDIPSTRRAAVTTTLYLASHSKEDLEDFNKDASALCAILRVEYNNTKWTEACLVLRRAQIDNVLQDKQVMWGYCHLHNRSSRN